MIVGLCGKAGSGKDTAADLLVKNHGFVKISLADPIKRAAADWFDWDADRLWGPSELRNAIDTRYPRESPNHGIPGFLSARKALQFMGTEIGRELYPNVWVEYAIRTAKALLEGCHAYSQEEGLYYNGVYDCKAKGVVVSDVRFLNEVEAFARAGTVIRITRPSAGLQGEAAQHRSETEQDSIPEELFGYTIANDGSIEDLRSALAACLGL